MRAFFSAWTFLTVLPVPESWKARDGDSMRPAFPVVGLLLGVILSLVFAGASALFSPAAAAVILTAAALALTGAIHLDGLADCADAFYGMRDREKVLSILKDPRIGTMGGTAIALSLGFRIAVLASIPVSWTLVSLPVLMMFSRSTVLVPMTLLPYARSEGGILGAAPKRRAGDLVAAGLAAAAAFLLLPVASGCALAAAAWPALASRRRIQGYTGDVLGAMIEAAELAALAALAVQARFGWRFGLLFAALPGA
jgi:adenosylcobinamide-GDP ribazoletransferase